MCSPPKRWKEPLFNFYPVVDVLTDLKIVSTFVAQSSQKIRF
jgi:hypothetical protein